MGAEGVRACQDAAGLLGIGVSGVGDDAVIKSSRYFHLL